MALSKIKIRWIEIMIIVMALGLLSLCFADWNVNKPADDDAIYTWDNSIRANNAALEAVLGVNLAMTTFEPDSIVVKSPWVDVTHSDYGAVGDGDANDSAAFQAAIDDCPVGGVVFVPSTTTSYRVANLLIKKPMSLVGVGFGSKLQAVTGATGYLIKIDGSVVGAVTNGTLGMHGGNITPGITIENLYLEGNMRGASIGGLWIKHATRSTYQNLWIFHFVREAINCNSHVAESVFSNIHTLWCADGSTYPVLNLKDMTTTVGRIHNELYFKNIYFSWPIGDHVQMDSAAVKDGNVRKIRFEQCFFHGIDEIVDSGGGAPNPFGITFSAAQKAFKFFDIGSSVDIGITDSRFLVAGIEVPGIDIATGSRGDPSYIKITNCTMSNHYGGSNTANDIQIHLQNGDLFLANNTILGNAGSTFTVKTEVGTNLYLGTNFFTGGEFSSGGGLLATNVDGEGINWRDTNFKNLGGIVIGADVLASAHYADISLADTGVLNMKETTTPTATPDYGKLYWKDDNKLYGQDGAGNEYEIDLTAD